MKQLLAIFTGMVLISGCSNNSGFVPQDSPNPWTDDYKEVWDDVSKWGTYNVHDPCTRKFGDTYYTYCTDVVWFPPKSEIDTTKAPKLGKMGVCQIRKSKDLVHWDFVGWAFDSIPEEAWNYVFPISGKNTANNIWAPYVLEHNGIFRMYYCLSTFGKKVSYIGLAESDNPSGPWQPKGCVVKTCDTTAMNAIDPTIVDDPETGKQWMIYGSFFGGLYVVELDKSTGLTKTPGDLGKMIAHRANYQNDNLEAPEVIYNPVNKKYYLFVSYGPLVTTYNVRVCISDKPDGPYIDMFGNDASKEVNTLPILTAPYRFENHAGWAGLAHCTVFDDGNGNYFMASQGRLQPDCMRLNFHIRRLFFRKDGWPVVSPERYAGEENIELSENQIYGEYEIISIQDRSISEQHDDGQSKDGLKEDEVNKTIKLILNKDNVQAFANNSFNLKFGDEIINDVKVFIGHDWENQKTTILFTCIDNHGFSLWGKKIK
ncbi:MAG: arabinan endo-1,5-alpha-L-arabinosidase [Bacteroidales bacterium]|nr:arabinan endo-1,5-alpha-L-arabinosidase [Bacteroidales bacterium]